MGEQKTMARIAAVVAGRDKRIKELEAQVAAVFKCPVYFEGGVMTIGDDGLFPLDGNMSVVDVMQALKEPDLDSWPCQHLHGGTPPFIYCGQTDGLCTHDECHPKNDEEKRIQIHGKWDR